jgi:outer membrane protein TolC
MNANSERFLCDSWPGRVVIAVAVLVLLLTGCNRSHYRRQADQDVYGLIERGAKGPQWDLEKFGIQPDPRSRFYDPDDPDRPPLPPDDPTSHELMHCVDGMKGWKHWHRNGDTPYTENPCWQSYLPKDETGAVVLDRDSVVLLALLHSREYQRHLEELYLAALDVSYERFLFDVQFFGGHSTFFTADGRLRGLHGAGTQVGDAQSTLNVDQDLELRRAFATGGELVVGAANSIVWQFSGDGSFGSFTLLDFSLVQPLLRGAGRAVALENLTEAERALLGNIRQMDRFRHGFYGQTVAGLNVGLTPLRDGPGLTSPPLPSLGGGGFFAILEEQVQIRNLRSNVDSLGDSMDMLQAAFDAGRIENRYQVDLARQAWLNAQARLLSLRTSHNDRLDTYKISLGLPPDLAIRVQDEMLQQFDLMAPEMMDVREEMSVLMRWLRDEKVPLPPDYLKQVGRMCGRVGEQLDVVEKDIQALDKALPTRRDNLKRLASRPELRNGEVDPLVVNIADLDRRATALHADYAATAEQLKATIVSLENYRPPEPAPLPEGERPARPQRDPDLQKQVATLSDLLLQLSVIQALTRLDTVTLLPVELDPEQAFAIACQNRLDWMNARAELVDRWRRIEIAADRLKAGLDVTFGGDLSTTDNNPFRFRDHTGRMRLGLEFDAPLTRLQERNYYREILIRYQQARRDYTAFVDRINQNLRNTLRQIMTTRLNFEVRRTGVFVSISQVDIARMKLLRPPKAGETSQMGATVGRDLVTAVTGLLDAQNSFLALFVDYETQRMNLDFELGTMRLDPRGIWLDPGPITPETFGPVDKPDEPPSIPGASPEPEEIPPGRPIAPVVPAPGKAIFAPPPLPDSQPPLPAPEAPKPEPAAPPAVPAPMPPGPEAPRLSRAAKLS